MTRLVVGIGNPVRGDDAAGLLAVQTVGTSETVVEHDGEPASLMALWQGYEAVMLIDAVSTGNRPGTIVEIDVVRSRLPDGLCRSTHALGPAEAVELARALGKLPAEVTLIGIEGKDYSFGSGLSAEVEAAVDRVVERVRRFVRPS